MARGKKKKKKRAEEEAKEPVVEEEEAAWDKLRADMAKMVVDISPPGGDADADAVLQLQAGPLADSLQEVWTVVGKRQGKRAHPYDDNRGAPPVQPGSQPGVIESYRQAAAQMAKDQQQCLESLQTVAEGTGAAADPNYQPSG